MRAAFSLLVLVMVSVSLSCPVVLGQKPVTVSVKADCCGHSGADVERGCKHQPKTSDKECCAGCALCLGVLPGSTPISLFPPAPGKGDTAYLASNPFRSDRPPVPPPRYWSLPELLASC